MDELGVLLGIFGFCLAFYIFISFMFKPRGEFSINERILFVVSHPDDEIMFFGPTITALTQRMKSKRIYLLCMSIGNYRNEGTTRKKELYEAAEIMGIPRGNIIILNFTSLQDDPNVRWNEQLVSDVIIRYVRILDMDTVITFDHHGVTGHKNHCSLYEAMASLSMQSKLPSNTRVLTLRSVNVLRKYSGVFDLPMSFLLASIAFVASISDWYRIQRAMAVYKSQYLWYRKLYMIFSRYVLINTYEQMNIPCLESTKKKK